MNRLEASTSFKVVSDQIPVTLLMQQLLLITSPFPVETCDNFEHVAPWNSETMFKYLCLEILMSKLFHVIDSLLTSPHILTGRWKLCVLQKGALGLKDPTLLCCPHSMFVLAIYQQQHVSWRFVSFKGEVFIQPTEQLLSSMTFCKDASINGNLSHHNPALSWQRICLNLYSCKPSLWKHLPDDGITADHLKLHKQNSQKASISSNWKHAWIFK